MMSHISTKVDYDFMAGKAHWKFTFNYEPHWHVVVNAYCTEEDELLIAGINSVSVTSTIDGSYRKFKYDEGDQYTNPFDWGATEVSPLARTAGHSARRENYSRAQPYKNPYAARRTETHKVEYDSKSESIRCSCLATSKHIWCKVIMDYVTKSLDVGILERYLDSIRIAPGKGVVVGEIRVPVMPRALLPIKVRRVLSLDQEDNAEPAFDFRLEVTDEVVLWHNKGDGLRGIVSEFFAHLNQSKEVATWKNEVSRIRDCVKSGVKPPRSYACPSKNHSKQDTDLAFTMVDERLNPENPAEERKNLLYIATLNALHTLIYKRCYACHVAFDPRNDVPVL